MYDERLGLSDTWRRRMHFHCHPVPDPVRIILLLLAVPTFLFPSPGAAQTENVPTGTNVIFSYDHYSMRERKDEQAQVHTITVKAGPNAFGGVSWALLDGGAQRGTDYEPVAREGRFATGNSTTHEIKIKIVDDDLVEPLETFRVRLSNPTGDATFPGGKSHLDATVEITDNDHVSITVDPVTVTEGASAQFYLKLGRVLRAGESAQVFVSTGPYDKDDIAPAKPTDDYSTIAPARSVNWSNGDQTQIVAVSTKQDEIDEPSEAFTLSVTNQQGVDLSDFVIPIATILDDDPTPVISVSSPRVKEGNDGYTAMPFSLMLDRPSAGPVTLNYVVSNASTAKWGEDFKAFAKGILTFLPSETQKSLTVEVAGDTRSEPNETVVLHLSQAGNATFTGGGETLDVTGTIEDDDKSKDPVAKLSLTGPPHPVEEGKTAVFRVELDRALTTDVEFQWRTFNGEARADQGDFTRVLWTRVTIPAGDTGVDLKVNTTLDKEVEETEGFTVRVRLLTTNGVVVKGSRTNQTQVRATILDGLVVSVQDAQIVTEGDAALFPVTLSSVAATDVTVYWKTMDGSAQAGSDYRAVPDGQVTIAAGDRDVKVRVLTLQDTIDEGTQEFSVILTKVDGAVLNVETAMGVIRDDDARPQITIADASVTEGGTARFRVMLSTASERPVSVRWQTADDTASVQSKDYVAASLQTVTIPAGSLHADIEVATLDDKESEGNERFKVLLSHAPDGMLKDDEAFGTIIDNEPLLVSVSPARVRGAATSLPNGQILEPSLNGSTELLFDIRLAHEATVPVTVDVQVLDGDENGNWPATRDIPSQARRGDYLVTPIEPGPIQFMPGETLKTFTVFVLGDTLVEGYEIFRVALDNPSGASVDPDRRVSTVTIQDDSGIDFFVPAGQPHVVREGGKISVTLERKPRDLSELAKQVSASRLNTTYRVCLYGGGTGNSYEQKDVPGRAVVSGGTLKLDDVFLSKSRRGQEGNHCLIRTDSGIPTVVWERFPVETWQQTVEIQTIQDDRVEGDETVTLLFRRGFDSSRRRTPQSIVVRHEITILDDDAHHVRVENASASEGSPIEFNLYVDPPLAAGQTGTVNYATADGTALAGVDYTARSLRQITVGAPAQDGAPAATISIPTTEDELSELTETFTLTLRDPSSGFTLGDADHRTATATIIDDDRLLVNFEDTVVAEGKGAVVTARLSQTVEKDVTITWKTVADSAESPADYDAVSGAQVTIRAGTRAASVRVATKKDNKDEFDEDFKVVATAVSPVSVHIGAAAVVTIRDHDLATLNFGAYANATIEENRSWKSVAPTLTGMPFKHVTWTLEGDDAPRFKINADTGIVRLSPQNYEKQKDKDKNNVYEVTVRATDEDGNSATSSLTVTVTNVETRVRTDSDIKVEGQDLQFEVVRESSTGPNVPITFKWRTQPDKDGESPADETDYTPVTKWQMVDMGKNSSTTLSVSTTDDDVDESDETMRVQLSDLSDGESDDVIFSDAGDVAIGLIFDDDTRGVSVTTPTLTLDEMDDPSTQAVIENQKTYAVQLTSQPTGTGTVTVNVASGDDAVAMVDKASLVFTAQTWKTAQTVTVTGVNDNTDNANNRRTVSITHTLSADNTDYKDVTADAVAVTVNDGDAVEVSVADASAVNEGNDSQTTVDMTFRVTLDKASEKVVTVPFTLGGTAVSGEDYLLPASLSLTIPAGSRTGDITVPVKGDTIDEVDETIIVTLGAPTNATVSSDEGAGTGTGKITDDDTEPTGITLTASPDSVGEEDGATTITVKAAVNGTTQYAAAQPVTVSVDGGTATAVTDYAAVSNFDITIAAGAASGTGTFTLTPEDDDVAEENETLQVSGTSGSLTISGDEITIEDDEDTPAVTLKLSPATIAESGQGNVSTVTAELSWPSSAVVTVEVSSAAVSPASAADFTQTGTALTIAAGTTVSTGTVMITAVNNDVDGPNKTVTVSGTASGGGVAHPSDVTLTIEDDEDTPTVTLNLSPARIAESGQGNVSTVTADLSGKSSNSVTVTVAAAPGVDTATTDYTLSSTTALTIPAGTTVSTGTVMITAVNNDVDGPNKTVTVSGTASGGAFAAPEAVTLTIEDDDTRSIAGVPPILVLAEADNPLTQDIIEQQKTYTVQLTSQPTGTGMVTITIESGDPTVATVNPASLEFTASAWGAKTVTVTGTDDDVDNASDRRTTRITHAVKADETDYQDLTVPNMVVVVSDDEVTPSFSVSDGSGTEGDGITFVVTREGASGNVVTVDWATALVASEAAETDFTAVPATTLTFAAGDTTKTVTVATTEDVLVEGDETFEVRLSSPAKAEGDPGETPTVADATATGTIEDNDATPSGLTLTAAPVSVVEGAGATEVVVTAAVNGSTRYVDEKLVTVSVVEGSATEPEDYAAVATFTITIAAEAASGTGTFTLTPANDTLDEPNETLAVNGTSGALTVTGDEITITDDDAVPSFSIADGSGSEGDGITFEVTRAGAVSNVVTVQWATALVVDEASATDFTEVAATTLTFAAGITTQTVTVTTTGDMLDESDEDFQVTLSTPGTADGDPGGTPTLTRATATGTITDDDDAPSGITLTATPDRLGEAAGATEIVVTAAVNGETRYVEAQTVTVSVESGTAIAGTDFGAVTGFNITIAAGAASGTGTFTLTPTNDVLAEEDETLAVMGVSGDLTLTPATITIEDNDDAPSGLTLTAAPASVGEGAGATTITVTAAVNGETRYVDEQVVTVSIAEDGATEPEDYAAVANFTITIAAEAASGTGTFTLTPAKDTLDEPDETLEVNGTSGDLDVTGDAITIEDDDATPSFSIADGSGAEGDGITFVVTRAGATSNVVTVDWATALVDGQAEATDFTAVPATTLTFAATETTKTVTVLTTEDVLAEPDEDFSVTLSEPGTADGDPGETPTLTRTTATGTITDDDATPTAITLTAAPDALGEAADATEIVVTAAVEGATRFVGATPVAVSVAGATATSGTDFDAVAGFTITIGAGAASGTGTFTLTPKDDVLAEDDETLQVTGVAGDLTITPDTITIRDDDAAPTGITLTANPASVVEGAGATTVTVTAAVNGRTRYVDEQLVTVSVADDSATSPADYAAVSPFTITIAAEAATGTGTFTLTPVNDTLDEPNETLKVNGDSGALTVTEDEITITDDDAVPSFSIADGRGTEGDAITFVVTRTGAVSNVVTVEWATALDASDDANAAGTADFGVVTAATLTFAAGVTAQTATIATTEDVLAEGDETFNVRLSGAAKADGDPGGPPEITRGTATGTIEDDDATPTGLTLTAAPEAVSEGAGATPVTVTAAVNGATRYVDEQVVTVRVSDGSATSPADYAAVAPFTITIAAGAASETGTFTLTPVSDTLDEPNETLDVTGASTGLQVTGDEIQITDDDGPPTFSVVDGSGDEGDEVTFAVTRAGASGNVVTVQWATALVEGGATAADFTAVPATTLTFGAGVTAHTVTVTTLEDTLDEPNEEFAVTLTGAAKAEDDPGTAPTITDATATGTITDDDAVPSFSVADGSGDEGDGLTFVVTRTGAVSNVVTVQWATALVADGASATDFTAVPATTLTFAAGDTKQTVTVTTKEDVLDEPNETFQVVLTGAATADGDPGGTPQITGGVATGTITDDDDAPTGLTLTANPARVGEAAGATPVTVTAAVNGSTRYVDEKLVTVSLAEDSATEPEDYAAVSTFTITIAAGTASGTGTFTLTPTSDTLDEPNETLAVNGTSGSLTVTNTAITITDDDAVPSFAIADGRGAEGDAITFVVTRGGATENVVTVQWATALVAGQAVGTDFTAVPATTLTFAARETEKTVTVRTTEDVLDEPNEAFEVRLSGEAKAADDPGGTPTVTDGTATGTITDDDATPTGITLTANPASVPEGGGAKRVTVTAAVNGDTRYVDEQLVTVSVAGDSATAAADYAAVASFTITIAPGAASGTGDFALAPVSDTLDEDDETLDVKGTSGDLTVTGDAITITDDDAVPSFAIADGSGSEGDGITFVVTRSGAVSNVVTVQWATALVADEASATDFTPVAATTLTFAAGVTAQTVTVETTEDVLAESNEEFQVTLSGQAKANGDPGGTPTLTRATATGTITDDDDAPSGITLTANPASVGEAAGAIPVVVTAAVNGRTLYVEAQTVAVSVESGTAVSGTDFDAVTGFNITIAAGAATGTGTFTLTPTNDVLAEENETLQVTGASGSLTITLDTITIEDNDATPSGITLTADPDEIGEEDSATEVVVTAAVNGRTRYVAAQTVAVTVESGTATSGTDFGAVTGFNIEIAAGAANGTGTFTLIPTNDTLDEPDETLQVNGASGNLDVTRDEITITDDDAVPSFSVADGSGDEGDDITFVVTRTGAVSNVVTVQWATALVDGGASATDFTAVTATTLTFAAGVTAQTVTVTTTEDTLDEPNEEFSVTLSKAGKADGDPGATPTLTRATATGTITDDDDVPSFSVADGSGDEGDDITFVVTRTGAVSNVVTVQWATALVADGASSTDFTAVAATTLTFGAGVTAQTVTVTTTEDVLDEADEDFQVKLSGEAKAADDPGGTPTLTDDTATGTITDDDDAPSGITLTATPDSVGEAAGATTVTVTAAVNGRTRYVDQKTVTVSVAEDSATEPEDYAAVSNFTITIAAGAASGTGTFTLTPVSDSLNEPNETLDVTGVSPGLQVTGEEITITDDDGAPSFSVADGRGAEGDGITFVVTRTGATGNVVTVQWATALVAGGAITADFTAVTATTLTFAAGVTAQTVTVTTTEDTLDEPNEAFEVKLSGAAKGTNDPGAIPTITDDTATGTITDDDAVPSFSVADGSGSEGDGITFIVTRTGAVSNVVTVQWATALVDGGASATDFTAVTATTLTFAAGVTAQTVTVTTTEDELDEPNEEFQVKLTGAAKADGDPGAIPTLTRTTATGTITDDDDAPSGLTLTATPDSVGEAAGATTVTVTAAVNGRTRYVDQKTVTVSVAEDSATEPEDYAAVSNFTITIAAGAASGTGTFTLTPVSDSLNEPNETLDVTGVSTGLQVTGEEITITDDDGAPSFSIADGSGAEGDGITFVVTRTGATGNVVTVQWATALVAGGAITADFTAVTATTLTFAAGVTAQTVTVTTTEDTLDEPNEAFEVKLSGAAKGTNDPGAIPTITDDTATGTITDDDDVPSFAIADGRGAEGDGITFVVTRTGAVSNVVTVQWATALVANEASATDCTAVPATTLTFAAGITAQTVTVATTADVLAEDDEDFHVTLSGQAKAADDPGGTPTLTRATATGTITDDDDAPSGITLTANPDSLGEAAGATQVVVTAAVNGSTRYVAAQTVAVSVESGTAVSGTDFGAVTGFNIVIAAGAANGTGTFTLTPTNDTLDEPNETLKVNGTSGILTVTEDTITITDDDAVPSFSVADGSGSEGDGITFVVTRTGAVSNVVTVQWATALVAGEAVTADFTAVPATTLTFAAGVTAQTVTVTTTEDTLDEPNEAFAVKLTDAAKGTNDPGATPVITDDTATGTINDDDAVPSFSIADGSGAEGDGITFVVTRTGAVSNVVTVDWATALVAGEAVATDFTEMKATTLTFAAGVTEQTVTVTTTDDVLDEPNEEFQVKLTDAATGKDDPGATPTLTDDTAIGTITDDDAVPSFSIADGSGDEGDGITFVVTRAGATGNVVTVEWATERPRRTSRR